MTDAPAIAPPAGEFVELTATEAAYAIGKIPKTVERNYARAADGVRWVVPVADIKRPVTPLGVSLPAPVEVRGDFYGGWVMSMRDYVELAKRAAASEAEAKILREIAFGKQRRRTA